MRKGWFKWALIFVCLRFISGLPLTKPKTNASWLYSGDKMRPEFRKATRLAYLAGWQRMLLRWSVLGFVIGYYYLKWQHPEGLQRFGTAALVSVTLLLAFSAVFLAQWWRHTYRTVRPILRAVSGSAGLPPNPPNPGSRLRIPMNYRYSEHNVIRLNFDRDTFRGDEGQKKMVAQIMTARLPGEYIAEWHTDDSQPYVLFKTRPHPPARVSWEDIQEAVFSSAADTLIMGRDTSKEIVSISLDNEAPHIALSMGTGGGKSSTLRNIIVQLLIKGVERIDIVDPKRISLREFKGHPRVFIHTSIPAMVEAIDSFCVEIGRRYDVVEEHGDQDFKRRVLLIEEGNSFELMVNAWWAQVKKPSDPKVHPVFTSLNLALAQGRQAKMNIFSVFQRMSAKASGGGDARENYGVKILARFSANTWKILIGSSPVWRSSRHAGRAVIDSGDDPRWVQMVFLSDTQARELAFTEEMTRTEPIVMEVVGKRFSLAEIARMEIVPMSYDSLRAAKSRDKDFPTGHRGKYTRKEIVLWYNARPSTTETVAVQA